MSAFDRSRLTLAAFGALMLAGLAAPVPAEAGKKSSPSSRTPRNTVKFQGGGETTAERDRRLLRECKGRPNAGACLGYTR